VARIDFDNSFARLPERFYRRLGPEPAPQPRSVRVNRELAARLGIDADWLASDEGVEVVAGNRVPEGAEPLAAAYAGHQFGSWNPNLGDGRALLLGEVVGTDGRRYDIQLKGSGRTPFSRNGDGKAPLGPVLREYVVSEAMHVLGVSTTRALAAVTTGEAVLRTERLPGAVLARVAQSHIRVGTFELFASRDDRDALRVLADHVIARHYPELSHAEAPYVALLDAVIARQAELIAQWQLIGFIHGVMNTDNMLVSGETIDFGPCAFMDAYDPNTVFSSIDYQGRYAFRNQPGIAHWNLAAFAQALLPLLGETRDHALTAAQEALERFPARFGAALEQGIGAKLGLGEVREDDAGLADDLFAAMAEAGADFTLTFRRLTEIADSPAAESAPPPPSVASIAELAPALQPWLERWRARFREDPAPAADRVARMRRANPALIPRNHLVEAAIEAAVQRGDFEPFHRLVDALSAPFDYRDDLEVFATPPRPEQVVLQTFCGT
jgi:uncharacterized protein YdiU (UPF0061 family)